MRERRPYLRGNRKRGERGEKTVDQREVRGETKDGTQRSGLSGRAGRGSEVGSQTRRSGVRRRTSTSRWWKEEFEPLYGKAGRTKEAGRARRLGLITGQGRHTPHNTKKEQRGVVPCPHTWSSPPTNTCRPGMGCTTPSRSTSTGWSHTPGHCRGPSTPSRCRHSRFRTRPLPKRRQGPLRNG